VKKLIVTADDFGAAREVNDAVEAAHKNGVLTAASLMVSAPAAADAVARAKATPSLRVGLHLVLVEGRPVLPPARVSRLVDSDGYFRNDMALSGAEMFFSPIARKQLAAEIEAQFEAFAATGLPLDHVNAHKHFHLHPAIAALVVDVGKRFGLKSARVPYEPASVLNRAEKGSAHASITTPFAALLRRKFRKAGLQVPDAVFGLAWTGALTRERLSRLIDHLPSGLSEIYCHPATRGGFPGSAPGYRYGEELSALLSPEVIEKFKQSGAVLGGFADFLRPGEAANVAPQQRSLHS
jgi:hopanoid biosynthesis associated protein HpnK